MWALSDLRVVFLQRTDLALAAHRGGNTLDCGLRGRKRRKVRNLVLDRGLADAAVVSASIATARRRVDDELDLAVLDRVKDIRAALADLGDDLGLDAVIDEPLRRALGRDDLEAQLLEAPHRGDRVGMLL